MCGIGALQRDQLARCHVLSRSQCTRIDSKEQVRCCRLRSTPFGYFNVDLIGSVDTTVGEETKHNIRIEFIDRTFDKPLVCTETKLDVGVQLGTCPTVSAGRATKFEMKLVILIQPNIARSPVVWSCNKSKANALSADLRKVNVKRTRSTVLVVPKEPLISCPLNRFLSIGHADYQ